MTKRKLNETDIMPKVDLFKLKSHYWKYFIYASTDKSMVKCTLCDCKPFSRSNNTTNMKRHLESHHKIEYQKLADEYDIKQTKLNIFDNKLQIQFRPTRSKINYLLAKMMINGLHPVSLVEDEGFRELINSIYPDYEIPSRKIMAEYIESIYVDIQNKMRMVLEKSKFIEVTTDIWPSIKYESYVALKCDLFDEDHKLVNYVLEIKCFDTESLTSDNIKSFVDAALMNWNIEDKEGAIVHEDMSVSNNASAKRAFCRSEEIITEKRNKLTCEHATELIFLNNNLKHFPNYIPTKNI